MNIYIHIPFCKSKCAYCAFLSLADVEKVNEYFESLEAEILERSAKVSDKKVETIYFGGGTPSLVKPKYIIDILNQVRSCFQVASDSEITLEVNPENINEPNLELWKEAGINRLSIGIQSLNDKVRTAMGRRLSASEVLQKVSLAQNFFDNVGVDLIAGLPGDNIASFSSNIEKINNLEIKHISLYDLELDKDSYLANHQSEFKMLDEVEREKFLLESWKKLEKLGFRQYEISNFTMDKNYSKHNYDFWLGKNYIGFGLGASSKIDKYIYTNTANIQDYVKHKFCEEKRELPTNERQTLKLILDLRVGKKINFNNSGAQELEEGGLIKGGILTKKGKILYNKVVNHLI